MNIKIGNIELQDWKYYESSLDWIRGSQDGMSRVIIRDDCFFNVPGTWKVIFCGSLEHLVRCFEIYMQNDHFDIMQNQNKEFQIIFLAEYVDRFLIRMGKLANFT